MRLKNFQFYFFAFLFILFCFLIQGCTNYSKTQAIRSARSNQIVAAAVVDSIKDTVRASVAKAGIIEKIYVQPGEYVSAGNPLLLLDDREEQLAVALNRTQLDEQKTQLSL